MWAQSALFLHRFRFPVYALFAVVVLAAAWLVPQADPLRLAVAVTGGFAVALALCRNFALALAAALAPLPGILCFGTSAYAVTIAFTILAATAFGNAMLNEENPLAVLPGPLKALGGTVLFALLWSLHTPVQLPSLLGASASSAIFLPALALSLHPGEAARTRANRQREALLRASAFMAPITEPRWSLSLSGVGLVLAVLAFFQITAKPPLFDGLAALAAGLILWGLARDVRVGLAGLAAAGLLLLFTGGVSGALLLFLFVAAVLGEAMTAWRGAGEGMSAALTRALEDHAPSILFAALAAAIAAGARSGAWGALHAGLGMMAALILFPAFAGALHHLFPPRRSVEDIYRSGA